MKNNNSAKVWAAQTTTVSYADMAEGVWDKRELKTFTIVFKNTHATLTAKAKLLGSVDGVNWDKEVIAEQTLTANGGVYVGNVSDYYPFVKPQIIDGTGPGTVEARAAGIET